MPFVRDKERKKIVEPSFYQTIVKHLATSADTLKNGYLELSIENPIEYDLLKKQICIKGGKTDTSFNKNIIKIPFESLSLILTEEETKDFTQQLTKVLKEVKDSIPKEQKKLLNDANDVIKTPRLDKVLSVLEQVSRITVNFTQSFRNVMPLAL